MGRAQVLLQALEARVFPGDHPWEEGKEALPMKGFSIDPGSERAESRAAFAR